MEVGESSGAKLAEEEIWAKLVPLDSRYSEVNIRSDEILVCSEIGSSSADKQEWCKISWNSDLCTATMQNVRRQIFLCFLDALGYLGYRFKISVDVEHAKCSICLNIWHNVVTVAPCLHNFCNGCFSEWLRRSQEKHSSVLCPLCRAVVQFVGRNHFLHNIVEVLNWRGFTATRTLSIFNVKHVEE